MGGAPFELTPGQKPPGEYPGWPVEVWTPFGGWYCNPVKWRRNSNLVIAGILLLCIPIGMKSAQLEHRPVAPAFPIPSQLWCKNFPKPSKEDEEAAAAAAESSL